MADNKKLYDNLLKSGKVTANELGDFNTFDSLLQDKTNATKLYNNLRKNDLFTVNELGDENTFLSLAQSTPTQKTIPVNGEQVTEEPIVEEKNKLSFVPQKNEVKNYMALFNKTPQQKTAEATDTSVEFVKQVEEAATKAETPTQKKYENYRKAKIFSGFKEKFPEYGREIDNIVNASASRNPTLQMQAASDFERIRSSVVNDPRYVDYNNQYVSDTVDAATESLLDDTKKIKEVVEKSTGGNWRQNIGYGFGKGVEEYFKGYTDLLTNINKDQRVKALNDKWEKITKGENVELTENEKLLTKALYDNFQQHKKLDPLIPTSYNLGKGAGMSAGFMAEFIATGAIARGVTTAGKTFLTAGRIGGALKPIELATLKLVETGIKTWEMPSLYLKAAQKVADGQSTGMALVNSWNETYPEILTEYMFMGGSGKAAKGIMNKIFERAGITFRTDSGVLGWIKNQAEEYAEEKMGEIYNAPKDHDSFKDFWKSFTNAKENLTTLGTVILLGGGMTAPSLIGSSISKARSEIKMNGLKKRLPEALRSDIDLIVGNQDLTNNEILKLIFESVDARIDDGTISSNYNKVSGDAVSYAIETLKNKVSQTVNKAKPEELFEKPKKEKAPKAQPKIEGKDEYSINGIRIEYASVVKTAIENADNLERINEIKVKKDDAELLALKEEKIKILTEEKRITDKWEIDIEKAGEDQSLIDKADADFKKAMTELRGEKVEVPEAEAPKEAKAEPEDIKEKPAKEIIESYGKNVDTKIGKVNLIVEPNTESPKPNSIRITAYDESEKVVGISSANIEEDKLKINIADIRQPRKGIYSKIVDEWENIANSKGVKLVQESGQTEEAKAFWENRNKPNIVTVKEELPEKLPEKKTEISELQPVAKQEVPKSEQKKITVKEEKIEKEDWEKSFDEFKASEYDKLINSPQYQKAPDNYKKTLQKDFEKSIRDDYSRIQEKAYIEGKEVKRKPIWSMTAKEWAESMDDTLDSTLKETHEKAVREAIKENKPVPDNVKAEYPELFKEEVKPKKETPQDLLLQEIEKRRKENPDYDREIINGLLTEVKNYNNLTPAKKRKYNIAALNNKASIHGLKIKYKGRNIQLIGTDNKIISGKRVLQKEKEEIQKHKNLNDYSEDFVNFVNKFFNLPDYVLKSIEYEGTVTLPTIRKAIREIKEGKKTSSANDYLDKLEKIFSKGVVSYKSIEGQVPDQSIDDLLTYYNEKAIEDKDIQKLVADPKMISVIKDFFKEGRINWDLLQVKLKTDIGYFNVFPFDLKDNEIEKLKTIVTNEEQRRIYEEVVTSGTDEEVYSLFGDVEREEPGGVEEGVGGKVGEAEPTLAENEKKLYELTKQQSKLRSNYNSAVAKFQKLKNKLQNAPELGGRGQVDIEGKVAGADVLELGGEVEKNAKNIVKEAEKTANDLKVDLEELTAKINILQQEINNQKFNQGELKFQAEEKGYSFFAKALGLVKTDLVSSLGKTARNGKINGVDVVIQQGDNANEAIIESIRTPWLFRGRGKATKALKQITSQADLMGITLKLRAVPEKGAKISQQNLQKWYEKNGFVFAEGSNKGVRSPNIRMQAEVSPIGFYSTVENALDKITQIKGTPEQFKAMLLKNGAKQAEMEWMDYDGTFTGKSVTKQEIKDWIDQNRIDVEEVTKGASNWEGDELIENGERLADVYQDNKGKWHYRSDYVEESPAFKTRKEAMDNAEADVLGIYSENDNKYSQYTTPGGQNYKEFLLTMPEKPYWENPTVNIKVNDEWLDARGAKNKLGISDISNIMTGDKINGYYISGTKQTQNSTNANFKSSHWDEPNILAHIRFNERTTADGERVLFLEEIQSDWAQEGKKKGVTKKWKPEQLRVLSSEEAKKFSINDNFWGIEAVNEEGQQEQVFMISKAKHDTKEKALDYIINNKPRIEGVPDMPFKKTDQWVNLALRRMMRYAAENGFDRIAWTTGEQQADRYDLSKQVDYIKTDITPYGRIVDISTPSSLITLYVDENGIITDNRNTVIPESKGKHLSDVIGKDITEKILGAPDGTRYEGEGLKVGGSGMKAFYDQIIPAAASKLGKPFGARVEPVEIPMTKQYEVARNTEDIKKFSKAGYTFTWNGENITKQRAYEIIERGAQVEATPPQITEVQSLPVTDQMKESVMKGVPLFQATGERLAPVPKTIFDNILQKLFGTKLAKAIITDKAKMIEKLNQYGIKKLGEPTDKVAYMATTSGEVYGFTTPEGEIYIDPDKININTPIHEYGHLWINWAKTQAKDLFDKGLKLADDKSNPYFQKIWNNPAYAKQRQQYEQGEKEAFLEEVLATAIGDKGEQFVNAKQKSDFKQWLTDLFDAIKKALGISEYSAEQLQDITFDEFSKAVAVELLKGEEIKARSTIDKATQLYYDLLDAEGASKKRSLAKQRRELIESDPRLKYIDDNIKEINSQLEKQGIIKKEGACP